MQCSGLRCVYTPIQSCRRREGKLQGKFTEKFETKFNKKFKVKLEANFKKIERKIEESEAKLKLIFRNDKFASIRN